MVAVLCYLVHLFLFLPCVVFLTPPFPLDVIPGPDGPGIRAVLNDTLDFVSVTFWSFLDRALECDGPRGKFSIIIGELGFKELVMDCDESRTMHGGLDGEGVRVRERLSDWVGPMVECFQLGVLGFPAEGRMVNSD